MLRAFLLLSTPMRTIGTILVTLLIAAVICFAQGAWRDDFQSGKLDTKRWTVTAEADFQEKIVDVVAQRLRMRADTIGTNDETVKYLGVRSVPLFTIGRNARISADVDWNAQANGSYLTAGIVLSPHKTAGNPLKTSGWFKVEYNGVPPGQNGRMLIATMTPTGERWLFTEGWPDTNRTGRQLAVQSVTISVKNRSVQVMENGTLLYDSRGPVLTFDNAYVYLQMSSHSNYRARELYFDNVQVSATNR